MVHVLYMNNKQLRFNLLNFGVSYTRIFCPFKPIFVRVGLGVWALSVISLKWQGEVVGDGSEASYTEYLLFAFLVIVLENTEETIKGISAHLWTHHQQ